MALSSAPQSAVSTPSAFDRAEFTSRASKTYGTKRKALNIHTGGMGIFERAVESAGESDDNAPAPRSLLAMARPTLGTIPASPALVQAPRKKSKSKTKAKAQPAFPTLASLSPPDVAVYSLSKNYRTFRDEGVCRYAFGDDFGAGQTFALAFDPMRLLFLTIAASISTCFPSWTFFDVLPLITRELDNEGRVPSMVYTRNGVMLGADELGAPDADVNRPGELTRLQETYMNGFQAPIAIWLLCLVALVGFYYLTRSGPLNITY